jgi:hypothetical protein
MSPPSPARLYATLVGAVLVVLGLVGFFSDLSWLNFLYVGSGALGLVLAACAPRFYALGIGLLYTVLAIWDFSGGDGWLHLAIGVLGLAAAAGTPRLRAEGGSRGAEKRRLKPRAKPAAERP